VESSQQPAKEASPFGSEEANEEVDHRGDEDDACSDVVQVVQSLLFGHHIQVPAGYNIHTYTHTCAQTNTRIQTFSTYEDTHTHT